MRYGTLLRPDRSLSATSTTACFIRRRLFFFVRPRASLFPLFSRSVSLHPVRLVWQWQWQSGGGLKSPSANAPLSSFLKWATNPVKEEEEIVATFSLLCSSHAHYVLDAGSRFLTLAAYRECRAAVFLGSATGKRATPRSSVSLPNYKFVDPPSPHAHVGF